MTPLELCTDIRFTLLSGAGDRPMESVYCGDLLSLVMGRAPAGCAWVTVMGNLNAIAVAVLADVAYILLAEGTTLADDALERAQREGVTVVATSLPVYEATRACDPNCED